MASYQVRALSRSARLLALLRGAGPACELRQAFRFFQTDRISSAEIGDRYSARRADLIRDFHSQLRDEDGAEKSPDRN